VKARRAQLERERVARDADLIRARCTTLVGFVREAWRVLEPEARYVHNWHIDVICAHLEAVTRGEINRLLINVWPGSMKSLIVSVFWPAWEWGPVGRRSLRHLSTAFNDGPVKRDTRRTRDLIQSDWYQTLWPEVVLTRTAEMSFANKDTGTREGVAFGSLTSQRGDRLIIDDPHSTETAESDVERQNTTRKFKEGARNRLNDQELSAIVIIMQRLHMDDISGVIEQYGLGYVHVMLPMEFEPARACSTPWGKDPRTDDGELADPIRFPGTAILDLKKSGEYFWAGQYQQRPAPREGGLFKVEKIVIIDAAPAGVKWVRGWDIAGSKRKTSPFTAGVLLGRVGERLIIGDARRKREGILKAEQMIVDTATDDAANYSGTVLQSIPQDPGSAGLSQKAHLAAKLDGLVFKFSTETGDKVARANPISSQVDAGAVEMVRGKWNPELIEEMRNFPSGSFKDQVDALSRAYAELVSKKTDKVGGMPESATIDTAGRPIDPAQEFVDGWGTPTDLSPGQLVD
jgi:predicted phage terminase large subunit-like protein